MNVEHDVAIVGGGVVGLGIGVALLKQGLKDVIVYEAEHSLAQHGSGRNSGVLHAGFYYAPNSLKAQLTRDGNERLRRLCFDEGVTVRECGKVVVSRNKTEVDRLRALESRAREIGVKVQMIDSQELAELEPEAKTYEVALWSPNTAVADPVEVTEALARVFTRLGGQIARGSRVVRMDEGSIALQGGGEVRAQHVVNSAGLYADRIAHSSGLGKKYVILPFKGLYLLGGRDAPRLKRHVYPVPDPRNPFLGVHLTVRPDGSNKIGPTAIPALSRYNYSGLGGVVTEEAREILGILPKFILSKSHNGIGLIGSELPKYVRSLLVRKARELVPSLKSEDYVMWGKSGIRAQLFDVSKNQLEMDFIIEQTERQTHVLNAVSPAWTSAVSLGEYVASAIVSRM